ncbi:hypothetical protein BpHYR1_012296 [Brachionus plicatilis]|uniref:Uncharacterized protein n=1 Tax=Brachionus plicatilis TaxID=10195 RepID=A0A3M7R763_BRAPC|nr:hypothetical protein BpHYR1_012296 [Brachionus plicatilis]
MRLIKLLQIYLTIFYGQLLSIGLFENLLTGIPELVENSQSYFNIARVCLGVLILIQSIFSIIVIWNKNFNIVFITGILLTVIFVAYIIVNTIHLTQIFSQIKAIDKYKLIIEVLTKSIILLLGLIVTFFYSSRGSYELVESEQI